jgi:hypothetical protein
MAETTHYVAQLVIVKVTKTPGTGRGDDRTKSEELKTTVKADTLPALKRKVIGHIGIMEEVDIDG